MNTVKDVIYTVFEREIVLNFLDQFDQIVFNPNIDVKSFITEKLHGSFDESRLNVILQTLNKGIGNPDDLFSVSKKIREDLQGLPVVKITVPRMLDQNYSTIVGKRVRDITGKQVLVEIASDPKIIGGAVIENDGRVGEYSFRRYFELKERRNPYGL